MMKPLPVGGFKWMTEDEKQNWKNIPCILEVDLEYPKELHDLHNDYLLAPERLKIANVEKLIPNLFDKKKYIVHHHSLKQYEEFGLKIKKIHRGIKFRVDVRLVNERKKAKKLAAKPSFKHLTIFDENLIAFHMKRTKLKFDKPVYCGMAILDLSRTRMYDFHYNYILPKYGKKEKRLFKDTDSVCYEIETEDFFQDISNDVEAKFDTSNFEKNHPSKIPVGKIKKFPE